MMSKTECAAIDNTPGSRIHIHVPHEKASTSTTIRMQRVHLNDDATVGDILVKLPISQIFIASHDMKKDWGVEWRWVEHFHFAQDGSFTLIKTFTRLPTGRRPHQTMTRNEVCFQHSAFLSWHPLLMKTCNTMDDTCQWSAARLTAFAERNHRGAVRFDKK